MDGCHRCGRTGHQARDCKQPMMCNKCGMRGHTEKNCGDSDNMKSARDRLREQKRQESDGHFTRECPRNGGSAASLIHSRNHEANMFAQERQRVLLQETAGEYESLAASVAKGLGGGATFADRKEAAALPIAKVITKVNKTTGVVIKPSKPRPKAQTLLNPLAEEDKLLKEQETSTVDNDDVEPIPKRVCVEQQSQASSRTASTLGELLGFGGDDEGESGDESDDPYA
eukprot:CAMPEP_0114270652 /NCGR_PEP_ID=MMETSP0058-20121206/27368_1 /TAXON_ID=36894 /ORGANISM="Pyramimonas parkeae, CCMP726" /LENGTH=227 /DNA_ID=CAMNT_0001389435 /DNA_START=132 /DNA_END=816 /DNA_ORIENTATION=+